MVKPVTAAIVGAGPSGLLAAQLLSAHGLQVTVYDRMPSVARKFLLAGRGGLNLTHSEPQDRFIGRYGTSGAKLAPMLQHFSPGTVRAWAEDLGQATFVGSSGRVFPQAMKASPLLRHWLARLKAQGAEIRTRCDWRGWDADRQLLFADAENRVFSVGADFSILALGGASWPRLGSRGDWVGILGDQQIAVTPLRPANCGFRVEWSEYFQKRFAGVPLKNVALSLSELKIRGEAMITQRGIEGGVIYALSAALRDVVARDGQGEVLLDLRPEMSELELAHRLSRPRGAQSLANFLRKSVLLPAVSIALLHESFGRALAPTSEGLARQIKSVRLRVTDTTGLDRAISTSGGVAWEEVDENLMLRRVPNSFVIGEMLDWEAPTGGYLLQGCFSTAAWAARAIIEKTPRSAAKSPLHP